MNEDRREFTPNAVDELEASIENKHDGVLAADATGMIRNEEFITVTELREGEATPPA